MAPDRTAKATLLAIGDVHLGTRPSSLPTELAASGLDLGLLTPAAALAAAVDRAIADGVDAVLFAGDVVESNDARFEAMHPLETAVRRLADAHIPVLAVAGNHDVEALPRLARLVEGFRLLGSGGRWESHVLHARDTSVLKARDAPVLDARDTQAADARGEPVAEIVGWSFPERRVDTSPLAQLLETPLPARDGGLTRIGLLHADLGAARGPYAPTRRSELEASGMDAWLLGHIHEPSLGRAARPMGYLGSLVGLDPSETGPRGPWQIRITHEGRVEPVHLAMAPLRWEHIDLPVQEDWQEEDVGDGLLGELERLAREIRSRGHLPLALGVRVRLVGRTRRYEAIQRQIRAGQWSGATRHIDGTVAFVDRVDDGLSLPLDLEEIAQGDDPAALLARNLLALFAGGERRRAILAAARDALRPIARDPAWLAVDDGRSATDPLADDALVARLRQAGTEALDALLRQRRDRGGAAR